MGKTNIKGVVMLLLTAAIWGCSFVAQSVGMASVEAFTFNGIRCILGGIVLLPVIFLREKTQKKCMTKAQLDEKRVADKKLLKYGLVLGIVFCAATNLQQIAFAYPNHSAGKIAFITAAYMFLVPIFGLFLRKKVSAPTWVCIVLGIVGLYFLCVNPADLTAIDGSDLWSLACAVFFAIQILMIERFAKEVDGVKLSCIEFWVCGIITIILMFIFEKPQLSVILRAAAPILYSGVCSCGIAYTLQIVGQRYAEATIASLIMCTESLFAVLAEALILGTALDRRKALGCSLMLIAIVISQLADGLAAKHKAKKDARS